MAGIGEARLSWQAGIRVANTFLCISKYFSLLLDFQGNPEYKKGRSLNTPINAFMNEEIKSVNALVQSIVAGTKKQKETPQERRAMQKVLSLLLGRKPTTQEISTALSC